MMTVKFNSFIKEWNKDMIPKFEKIEAMKFETYRKLYFYIVENLGSGAFTYLTLFNNKKKVSDWDCSLKCSRVK